MFGVGHFAHRLKSRRGGSSRRHLLTTKTFICSTASLSTVAYLEWKLGNLLGVGVWAADVRLREASVWRTSSV